MAKMSARKRRRIQLLAVGGFGLAAAAAIAGVALNDAITFFVTPSELIAKVEAGEIGPGSPVRLGGMVEAGSIDQGSDALLRFRAVDNDAAIAVTFRGVPPDLFEECEDMVALGVYRDGVFEAQEILAKHDENYQPPEIAGKIDPGACVPS